jgi:hypothetical protein
MKLFQQLLVAPAALGLLAPFAAHAADINLSGVNQYASEEQVTSINQFSDVKPTDWAFQALSNLIERYGCVAGYPDGTYRGQRAMTRYEAAALLNACLDRITEITDELKKLMKEFEKELAVIRGRVDGLEARVGELEATQFSTTTKLKGVATFVLGANSYSGSSRPDEFDTAVINAIGGTAFIPGTTQQYDHTARLLDGATAFNYDLSLYLDTSFTGKDLLRTRLRAGNFGQGPWSGTNNPIGLNAMEIAFEENCGSADCGDVVAVNRLFYQFPIGSSFTATVGGRVRQDDMLAMWPSAYPADTVLDIFTYAGSPGTYNLNLGAGGGLWWKSGNFSVSASYVSANGDSGSPGFSTDGNQFCGGGIGTACSSSTFTGQIAYGGSNYGLAVAYNYSQGGAGLYGGNGTPLAVSASSFADSTNSVGVSAFWTPYSGGWFPSISVGWGISGYQGGPGIGNFTFVNDAGDTVNAFNWIDGARSQSWYAGLQWADVFWKGNAFGMAVGQPTFITSVGTNMPEDPSMRTPNDGNYAWEWWYKFQVTDNISVTPAIYYLSAPLGQLQKDDSRSVNNFGGLVKTTFRF